MVAALLSHGVLIQHVFILDLHFLSIKNIFNSISMFQRRAQAKLEPLVLSIKAVVINRCKQC